MKKLARTAALILTWSLAHQCLIAQTATVDRVGEHFSLEGVLELFSQSDSPEDFEKKLNTEASLVNNLDLNDDGETDYLKVIEYQEGDARAITIQAIIDKDEYQDIAVIEIEKTGHEEAILQIIGDEDIYGQQKIVEPYNEELVGGTGGPGLSAEMLILTVNVWTWASVRHVYRPRYKPWISPYRYGKYPRWWRPWSPAPIARYRSWNQVYRGNFRVANTHRVVRAHRIYTPRRSASTLVQTRYGGRKTLVQRSTTTTAVRRNNGQVSKHRVTKTTARPKKKQRTAKRVKRKKN